MLAFKQNSFVRFVLVFSACFCVLFLAFLFAPPELITKANLLTASLTEQLIALMGIPVVRTGTVLNLSGFRAVIIGECSGFPLYFLFASFVVAYPARLKDKLTGILVGVAALYAVNVIRLGLILPIGMHSVQTFTLVHDYFSQAGLALLTFLGCIYWADSKILRGAVLGWEFLLRLIVSSLLLLLVYFAVGSQINHALYWLANVVLAGLGSPYRFDFSQITDDSTIFNLLAYLALIVSSRAIAPKRKLQALLVGLAVLVCEHITRRVAFGYINVYGPVFIFMVIKNFGSFFGRFILPLLLWIWFHPGLRAWLWPMQLCPICGKSKRDLRRHVAKIHGQESLELPEVQRVLGQADAASADDAE